MAYIHVTTSKNARKILEDNFIKINGITIEQLFEQYIERLFVILEHGAIQKFLDKMGERLVLFPDLKYPHLGVGIYCFKENDYIYAENYGKDNISGEVDYVWIVVDSSERVFDLNNKSNFNKIKEKIENDYFDCYLKKHPGMDENSRLSLELIIQIVMYQLDIIESNDFQSFVLGVSLDMYREITMDLHDSYYFTFYNRKSDYVVIKNKSIIKKLENYPS